MTKITVIGAGSVVFAKNLINDILSFPELSDTHFALVDIDPERLEMAEAMARNIIAQRESKGTVESFAERREALPGSDFIINMIQVGGYESTLIDFDVPEKYGLKQTIADTIGIGGIFRGLRTIPVAVGIGRDVAELCPDALLLNYTNPMSMVSWAVLEETGINAVGLCHGIRGTANRMAQYVGLEPKDISYRCGGINHMAWFVDFRHGGEDLYPKLFAAAKDEETFKKDPVRFTLFEKVGLFMTESSEHTVEYVPYFIQHEELIPKLDVPIREYVRRCEEQLKKFEGMKEKLTSGEDLNLKRTEEYASEIIHSVKTGAPLRINGNVLNHGLIPNLPDGCCVEVPCLVDDNGLQPICFGNLPPQCAALCRTNINVQELTVRASLDGKRDHVYHAAMLDPHTASVLDLDQIVAMCDDLFEAHGDMIPGMK
jgi:alpha-galactosidase